MDDLLFKSRKRKIYSLKDDDVTQDELSDMERELQEEVQMIRRLKERERDIEEQILWIRKLKGEKKYRGNMNIDSDEEEDPRQLNDRGQETSYFKKRKLKENEDFLKQKIEKEASQRTTGGIFRNNTQSSKSVSTQLAQSVASQEKSHTHQVAQKDTKPTGLPPPSGSFASRLESAKEDRVAKIMNEKQLHEGKVFSFEIDSTFKPLEEKVNEKDEFSGKYLSKRYISSDKLKSLIGDKKVMRLEELYAKVVPPKFETPRFSNFIIVGIISGKSDVKIGKNNTKSMRIYLTSFKSQITFTILDKAFEMYRKLRVGDVIAILNPSIFRYVRDNNKPCFSLTASKALYYILEIGRARDFGLCQSVKRDGHKCNTPIDTSKSEYCDYHTEMSYNKAASKRLELSGTHRMFAPGASQGSASESMYLSSDKKHGKEVLSGHISQSNGYGKDGGNIEGSWRDPRIEGKIYCTNPDATRAFFDDQYSKPDVLNLIQNEKRRNKIKLEERRLQRELSKISGAESLRSKAIETESERNKRLEVTRAAFGSNVMTKIGFNPTRRVFEKVVGDNQEKGKEEENLSTAAKLGHLLKDERQKSNKSLNPSKEFLTKKKEHWKQVQNNLDSTKKNTISGMLLKNVSKTNTAERMVQLSDSDSD
ncbi:hypothetical protein B5S32_g3411 [[Candida] boidinii]|nr:hypothetical protein B5S29_g3102 [[Candida] boidinii]OWB79197.1 hypothetical protein B5S32_g3411 [[Candida] boidinii]